MFLSEFALSAQYISALFPIIAELMSFAIDRISRYLSVSWWRGLIFAPLSGSVGFS
jgi:hypothetical protein